ncbi:unnamed protein product [Psylliodes chrysocephalus]|uniref:Carboxylic ester hydrolase n=1 Tax=Psylliodes chrysocephalus TaxID=3402493 RepID=A0A9P0CVE0_9CUCU|nr:unnamed protein product [Psylliodes chrysocephala]
MVEPIVDTVEGKLRGCVRKNLDGEDFYSFLGVRYAKAPIGDLRFKDPQPLDAWTGIKDATNEGVQFYQIDSITTMTKVVSGTEDGLHMNIFTRKPILQGPELNPVMVWIHGGGFREGRNNTDIYGPEFLMLEDIVLVSINYRLGILGSLKLDDPSLEVFGNAGMKDQIAALKWIQRNIRNFGGDPNNVTIFGESAGGASVQYLVLSPAAKGLFHKAIMQSGVVINTWAYGYQYLKDLMVAAGKENLSEKELLNYLRSLSLDEVYRIQEKINSPFKGTFSPKAENPNPTAFITKHPFEYLISGQYNKVPILMGYCSNELLLLKALLPEDELTVTIDQFTPKHVLTQILNIQEDSEVFKKLDEKLKSAYKKLDQFQLISDVNFIMGIIGCAINHAKTSDKAVYLYRLSLDSERNYLKRAGNLKDPGVSHLDDIGYLFKTTLPLPDKGSPEDGYVRRFVKLWTNFARHGNPTPEDNDLGVIWKPVEKNVTNFLDIDKKLIPGTDPESDRIKIWKEVYQAESTTAKFL